MPAIHLTYLLTPLRVHHPLSPRLLLRTTTTTLLNTTTTTNPRPFSTTPSRRAGEHLQDKDELNPIGTEYSKSGGDYEAAHDDAAFDPEKTTPEETKSGSTAQHGTSGSTLEVSPANQDVSQPRPAQEGGAQRSESESKGERKMSGAGSPPKKGSMTKGTAGGGGSA